MTKRLISLRVEKKLYDYLEQLSKRLNITISDLIRGKLENKELKGSKNKNGKYNL